MNTLNNSESFEEKNIYEIIPGPYHSLLNEIKNIFGKDFEKFVFYHLEKKRKLENIGKEISNTQLLWQMLENMSKFPDLIISQHYINISHYLNLNTNEIDLLHLDKDAKLFFSNGKTHNFETPDYIKNNLIYDEESFFQLTGVKFYKIMRITKFLARKIFEQNPIMKEYKSTLNEFAQRWIFEYIHNYILFQALENEKNNFFGKNISFEREKGERKKRYFGGFDRKTQNFGNLEFDAFSGTITIYADNNTLKHFTKQEIDGLSIGGIVFLNKNLQNPEKVTQKDIIKRHENIHRKNNHLASYLSLEIKQPNQILDYIMDEIVAWIESGDLDEKYNRFLKNSENKKITKFEYLRNYHIKSLVYDSKNKAGLPIKKQQNEWEKIAFETIETLSKSGIDLALELSENLRSKGVSRGNLLILTSPKNWYKLNMLFLEQKMQKKLDK